MSWETGSQKIRIKPSTWDELNSAVGNLTEDEARIWLAKYFRSNIGILYEMLATPDSPLLPIQEILIKSLFLRDSGIVVAARGFSKSWLLGICSLLIPILSPGSGICLISANFRGARRILEGAEKIVDSPKAILLQQCFSNALRRSNDVYKWKIDNGSEVFALPLNAEGLRGHRATWLFIDEGLLISKEIQENILRPFLSVKQNAGEEMRIRAIENSAIKEGVMTEDERIDFPKNKFFVFSSASFKFQYLFELYTNIINNIMQPKAEIKAEDRVSYFAMRFSYKVLEELPNHAFLDMTQVNAAKDMAGEQSDYFQREWMGAFPDISDGYFNIKKLHECTVKFGDEPCIQLKGEKDSRYILSIDPAYSDSKKEDYFAMGLYLLSPETRQNFLINSYTQTGGELRNHYLYLSYLLTHFNIVFINIDASGNEFIKGFNESTIAKERNLKLEFLDVDLEKDQLNEYNEEIIKAKNQYNITSKRIVYCQPFNSLSIRKMNEHLKNQIENKKVWFASRISIDENSTKLCNDILDRYGFINKKDTDFGAEDFLEEQNRWIEETKAQTALIQVKATPLGTLQYDLPQSIKRSTSENKARRDSYTCLLMGNMAATHYYNIVYSKSAPVSYTFAPIIIR
jgi:hypothetical protein